MCVVRLCVFVCIASCNLLLSPHLKLFEFSAAHIADDVFSSPEMVWVLRTICWWCIFNKAILLMILCGGPVTFSFSPLVLLAWCWTSHDFLLSSRPHCFLLLDVFSTNRLLPTWFFCAPGVLSFSLQTAFDHSRICLNAVFTSKCDLAPCPALWQNSSLCSPPN